MPVPFLLSPAQQCGHAGHPRGAFGYPEADMTSDLRMAKQGDEPTFGFSERHAHLADIAVIVSGQLRHLITRSIGFRGRYATVCSGCVRWCGIPLA